MFNIILFLIFITTGVLLIDSYVKPSYRIIEVSISGKSLYKIQYRGFLFWKTMNFAISPYSEIIYFDNYNKALHQVKHLKNERTDIIRIIKV